MSQPGDIPATMRAALFADFGGPEVVEVMEVQTPSPGPDEVLIEVRAAAFNHLDLWVRRGIPIQTTMPHIGGSDVAGVVAVVGSRVTGWKPGDEVLVNPALSCGDCRACRAGEMPFCREFRILGEHTNGGFAEYMLAPADNIYRLPQQLSVIQAACLPISYQTAWRALITRARLRPGEEVLVIGASGGTAMAAVQIAKMAGARVFAVTSGPEHVAKVKTLGADVVYDRLVEDFSERIAADTDGRGVDVVVENVGEPTWKGSVRSLANGGRLVTYGATSGPRVSIDIRRLFWNQLELIGTTMATKAEFEAMLRAAESGRLTPVVDSVLDLDSVRDGHALLEEGRQFGKVVVEPRGKLPT